MNYTAIIPLQIHYVRSFQCCGYWTQQTVAVSGSKVGPKKILVTITGTELLYLIIYLAQR